MEITGLCSICGRPAKPAYSCRFCGHIVCGDDFIYDLGLCARCAGGFRKIA